MEYLLTLLIDPAVWIAFATLTAMEIILGIDNLLFISILTNKLPAEKRSRTRRLGISAALVLRLGLLSTVAFIASLTEPFITFFDHGFSIRDLILIAGGFFLVWKATKEIHYRVDPDTQSNASVQNMAITTTGTAIIQILILDMVFSIDSIITAIGMTNHIPIMLLAVIVSVSIMLLAADPVGRFIEKNPTLIMLVLGFLLLIGTMLIAEGFGFHVPKGYIYTAMAFSAFVEALNMWSKKSHR